MKSIIKVVGVGGGGSNAVRNMFNEGIEDVTYLIVNTDKAALEDSPIPNKLQISEEGLGAGAQPDKAQAFALQYEESIRTKLNDGTKMVFITAGMGGGTGTGASPVVARIAHEMGILTIGIVTIPFKFEGRKKIQMALQGVAEIRKYVDALLVVNNNRLIEIYPDLEFYNAFKKADDTLTYAVRSISDIINKTGYINLDFADVEKTLKGSGVALISMGDASGEQRVTKAIEEAIKSPLLQDNKITDAKHLLFELCFSGKNPVSMEEIAELNNFVDRLSPDIEVIWGALQDDTLNDNVRLIILAAGFEMDGNTGAITAKPEVIKPETAKPETAEPEAAKPEVTEPEPTKPEPVKEPVKEPEAQPETQPEPAKPETAQPEPAKPEVTKPEPAQPVQPVQQAQPSQPSQPAQPTPTQSIEAGLEEIGKFYGMETAEEFRMEQIRKNYYILDNADLSNEELVELLEHMPAYNRSMEQIVELKSTSKSKPSTPNTDGSIF
jgi:cell division protein FtsZ